MAYGRFIPAAGSTSARIALIGESPWRHEDVAGRPFAGPSGALLDRWWYAAGLTRADFWIDNVFPHVSMIASVGQRDVEPWANDLHDRIAALDDPYVIVPTGNVALRALTGKSKYPWEPYRRRDGTTIPGIEAHRGSIYEYVDRRGRRLKVIPTIHPAATFRQPMYAKVCVADWQRIAADAKHRDLRLPQREHFIRPTLDDLKWYADDVLPTTSTRKRQRVRLAIDCEWVPGGPLLCVGFAATPSFSMTVPTTLDYWKSKRRLADAMAWIAYMCGNDIPKVLQHGHSDAYVLRRLHDIAIAHLDWDTLAMHHVIDPNAPHTLQYIASVYTRQQYWKDEAKSPQEMAKYANNIEALWTYNGIDAAVTRELYDTFHAIISERDMLQFYDDHYRDIFTPLLDIMLHGINTDDQRRRRAYNRLQADCIAIQDDLTRMTGKRLYGARTLSSRKIMSYCYDDLRLAKQTRLRKRKGNAPVRTPTADEIAIRRLMLRYGKKFGEVGEAILQHRRKYQLMTFYA